MGDEVNLQKSVTNSLNYFWQLVSSEKKNLSVLLTYQIGVGLLSLAIPIGVQLVVNTIAFSQIAQPIIILATGLLIAQSLSAFLRAAQIIIVEKMQLRLFSNVSMEVAYRIPKMKRFRTVSLPEVVNRFFDLANIQKALSFLVLEGSALFLQMLISLILLAFYHPILLAFDILLIICILFIIFILGRGAISTSIEESYKKYKIAAWLEELSAKTVVFSSKNARLFALEHANNLVFNYLDARSKHFNIVFRQVLGLLILQVLANTSLIVLGVNLIAKNQLTIGQLVAAEIVVSSVLYSFSKAQKHLDNFYDLIASLGKVGDLLEQPLEEDGSQIIEVNQPIDIKFKEVFYTYPSITRTLGPLTFSISPGSRVLLLGANGSGKSTIVDLIYGLRTCDSGMILLNGSDVRYLSKESLRQEIALVRGVELVSGTILKNVKLRNPKATIQQVDIALKKTGLFDEIHSLPAGLETFITDKGDPLSISQAKRLMLARAILGGPKMILIDETLDSLDESSREIIVKNLFMSDELWTILTTSSSADIKNACNLVIDLKKI